MDQKMVPPFGDSRITRVQSRSETDYVKDGVLFRGSGSASVMVTAQTDLAKITDKAPGTIAYTAGFANMWQLAADGSWVAL